MKIFSPRILSTLVAVCLAAGISRAADWPMWEYDAQRSCASPQELAPRLFLQWTRDYPPEIPAWPEQEKMPFDVCYEPIVVGKTLFLNSSRHDCIRALDVDTGERKWIFFANGPIRFAPTFYQGKLYFTSDDGHLYCLDAETGSLVWKQRGSPGDRRILGNERIISTWPARGAPVIADGTLYYAASIWPFMGIFIHAVDPMTGKTIWTNDGDGSIYMKQPHMTDAFAGIAPQGSLAVMGDLLLIPGGRSIPACFDRKTGKLLRFPLAENGKRGGGHDVAAWGNVYFNGGAVFELATGKFLGDFAKQVVLTPKAIYAYHNGAVRSYDPASLPSPTSKDGKETKTSTSPIETKSPLSTVGDGILKDVKEIKNIVTSSTSKSSRWMIDERTKVKTPIIENLVKAGPRLYAGGDGFIMAIDVDPTGQTMEVSWEEKVPGKVCRLIAGADRLFVATREGPIYCFGPEEIKPLKHTRKERPKLKEDPTVPKKVDEIAQAAGTRQGYAVVHGLGNGDLTRALIRQTKFDLVVLEADEEKVLAARRQYVGMDLYGTRVSIISGDPRQASLPPYFCSLMICADLKDSGIALDETYLAQAFSSLRPFGGTMIVSASDVPSRAAFDSWIAKLPQAKVQSMGAYLVIKREGPIPGSADWTHEHADAANTRVGKDQVVKAPLGLLWFGGPSHDGILPRHGHGPQPQVIEGRIIIEGVDLIRALDIYTGRLLWQTKLPGVGGFFNNLAHQAGANASGSNFVCMRDGIYIAYNSSCVKLDPETGKVAATFKLPEVTGVKGTPRWGYINVAGDYLIGGADPIHDPKNYPPKNQGTGNDDEVKSTGSKTLDKVLKSLKPFSDNMSASRHLVVMDRHTGKVLWRAAAHHAFRHNGTCIGGGKLYTLDRLSGDQLAKRKVLPEDLDQLFRLVAYDLATGKQLWECDDDVFGTWLGYSAEHDVLVEAGRVSRDTLRDEPKGMRAFRGKDGAILWHEKNLLGPAMIHHDSILLDSGACELLTGKTKMRKDPITDELVPWRWTRTYGCNTPSASEHLLTFRSGAAGYFDLCNDGGTGNFGGFRSSCTNNLIVAGGILTVPEYTRTCTCSYQNQTSVALIPMADAEMWTYFGTKDIKGSIKRLGINLGAIGDRRAEDGVLWLENPSIGGVSPLINVTLKPSPANLYRRHPSTVSGPYNWVTSSGAKGLQEISVPLGRKDEGRKFTVRLYFAEPEDISPAQRRFHIDLQGERRLTDLDISKEAGGPRRTLIKEFTGVPVFETLTIRLTPASASLPPVISGVEVVVEETP